MLIKFFDDDASHIYCYVIGVRYFEPIYFVKRLIM